MKRLAPCLITLSILISLWLIGWPSQEVQAADGGGGYRVYLPAILTGDSSIPATGGQAEAVLTLETFAAQVADGRLGWCAVFTWKGCWPTAWISNPPVTTSISPVSRIP